LYPCGFENNGFEPLFEPNELENSRASLLFEPNGLENSRASLLFELMFQILALMSQWLAQKGMSLADKFSL
jgi:hypothetical protein